MPVSAGGSTAFPGAPFMAADSELSASSGFSTDRLERRPSSALGGVFLDWDRDLRSVGDGVNNRTATRAVRAVAERRLTCLAEDRLATGLAVFEGGDAPMEGDDLLSVFQSHLTRNLAAEGTSTARNLVRRLWVGDGEASDLVTELAFSGVRAAAEAARSTGAASDLHALAHLELDYTLSSSGRPIWSAIAVQPLYETGDSHHSAFAQLGMTREAAASTYNAGLAYRGLTPDRQWLIGPNAFFDYSTQRSHTRFSIGLDAKSERFGLSANRYFRLKDWKDSRFGYEERALSGYDLEISGRLPGAPNVELFARQFLWWRDGETNLTGRQYAVEYSPVPVLRMRLALVDPNDASRYAEAGTQLRYRFGVPLSEQLRVVDAPESSVLDRRYEKVRRENIIRTQERLKAELRGTVTETVGANTIISAGLTFAASVGGTVPVAATIVVADTPGAVLRIRFGSGALLTVGQNSTVEIGVGVITLISGLFQYTSGSVAHVINVPGGTIELLGTDIDARSAAGISTVRVRDGAIRARASAGPIQEATARDMVVLGGGSVSPVAAGTPTFEDHAESVSLRLDWVGTPLTESKVAPYPVAAPAVAATATTVGQTAALALNFSRPVTVSGAPRMTLTINGTPRTADYASGSGSATLLFTYTLLPGDDGASSATITSIDLNGGDILTGTLPAVVTFADTVVDLGSGSPILPSPAAVVSTNAVSPTDVVPIPFTITFNQPMTGDPLTLGELVVVNGTAANLATADNIVYTVEVTPTAQGTVSVQVPANAARNPSGMGHPASNVASVSYATWLPLALNLSAAGATVLRIDTADGSQWEVDWGDGTVELVNSGSNRSHAYAAPFNGSVRVRSTTGAAITRLQSNTAAEPGWAFNVADLPAGLTHLQITVPNTISGDIADLPTGLTHLQVTGSNSLLGNITELPARLTYLNLQGANVSFVGDIAALPAGLTYLNVQGPNTSLSGNVAALPSSLTYLNVTGSNTLSGDVAALPAGLTHLRLFGSTTLGGDLADLPAGVNFMTVMGANTLTMSGTIWAAATSMRQVRINGTVPKPSSFTDNLLIALSSVGTWTNERLIDLQEPGVGARTAASDAAVATLTGLGVTVETH
ncbi:Soluble lytic murein transglycosylase and regulatory protein [Polymorphum gilvum SL003B-26A1]|uniref:Soluble lytic murein transglycosylase and regulatory protein n=2 Tax=Polymorphum TaxID=991903 RepID=F2IUQ1_POLGS|nr:Soluble lytic murein transglycosylase and regulatory protein [Polymorphum gilvum SL003B-26A1]